MAFVTNAKLYLKQKFNAWDTSFRADRNIWTTSGRIKFRDPNNLDSTYLEWVSFSGIVDNGDTTFTYTVVTNGRNMSLTAIPSTGSATGKTFGAGSEGTLVAMHDQLLDPSGALNFSTLSLTWDLTVAWKSVFTTSMKVPVFADTVARDTAIPTPSNGMECYITGLWTMQDYVLWAWTNRAAATVTTSPTLTETAYESIITAWDLIGQTPDGIYKVQTEIKTSSALGGSRNYKDHCTISTGKFFVVFEDTGVLYWVIASLSSTDVMTWGTPVTIGTAATPTAKVALINTNKVIIVYAANASVNVISVIATVSGTTFSLGTALSEIQSGNAVIPAICKVRTDVYAYCFGVGVSPSWIKVNTVSGTTITAGTILATFAFWFTQNTVYCAYLSDNTISFSESITSNTLINVKIYAITPGSTTVATTYTSTITATNASAYHARYSDTEVIITNSVTTEKSIFTIPWAGTTLTKTTLTATWAVNYPVTPLYTNIYAVNTGSTILIYQRDILIGTIASTPAYNTQSIQYDNGRVLFISGATLIPTIVNLARVFQIGIAYDASWKYTIGRNFIVKSGVLRGYRYYQQLDGTIVNGIWITNTVTMTNFFGRWVLTDRIMIEI